MALAETVERPSRWKAEESSAKAAETVTLIIENMNCGGCLSKIERTLNASVGVVAARGNLSARRASVTFDPTRTSIEKLIGALEKAGYKASELLPELPDPGEKHTRDLLARMAVAGFAAANIMLFSVSVWSGESGSMDRAGQDLFHWLSALIALPTVAYSGQPFFRSAWQGLKAFRLGMDVPISLAILLSTIMSLYQTTRGSDQVYFDASVTLLFFLLTGRFLDQRMRTRARGAAQNLLGLKAAFASVIRDDGAVERIPSRLLSPGMRIAVATGERFPADGVVIEGRANIDESLITGETTPRDIALGDRVYAGTINLGAPIKIKATAIESGTLIAEISRLMAEAEQSRGRYVRLADRAARFYSPAVHILAALTFTGWMIAGNGWEEALTAAIAVLIITCPCALALAVPAVQVAAMSRLFARGVLVKASDGLERLSEIDTVVFDKTGTLTLGVPKLKNAETIDPDTLKRAAALAVFSRHPYAQAVAAAARERFGTICEATQVIETPGSGLKRETAEGEERLGSASWCGVDDRAGASASLWYVRPGSPPMAFAFEDVMRTDAKEVVAALKAAHIDVEMLSGDRENAVAGAAREAGIARWTAAAKPGDKIAHLKTLKAAGRRVLMAGDGLNDAPALASAHASLSPSSAADISQNAADALFQGAHLSPLLELLATARKAQRMALENFAIAGGYNLIFVPLAMAGLVTPLIAAIAMSTSSILVTANALRLRTMHLSLRGWP